MKIHQISKIHDFVENHVFVSNSQVPKNDTVKMSLYLAMDASSGANSFETEKLRLSAFQNGVFQWISTSKRPLKVDFESPYREIDASSDANSFEIEKLRLSAFQNCVFCGSSTSKRSLNVDFESLTRLCILKENHDIDSRSDK